MKFFALLLAIALLFGGGTAESSKEQGETITIQFPSCPEIQGIVSKITEYLELKI